MGEFAGWRASGRRPQGFRSKSKSFQKSLSNLVNMLVCIISRPSSITSQIHPGTPELWPLNCPKLGFPHAKAKSFCPALIKLGLWLLNWPKTELAVSAQIFCPPKCCHFHWIYHKYDGRILCQFGTLVKSVFCITQSIFQNAQEQEAFFSEHITLLWSHYHISV